MIRSPESQLRGIGYGEDDGGFFNEQRHGGSFGGTQYYDAGLGASAGYRGYYNPRGSEAAMVGRLPVESLEGQERLRWVDEQHRMELEEEDFYRRERIEQQAMRDLVQGKRTYSNSPTRFNAKLEAMKRGLNLPPANENVNMDIIEEQLVLLQHSVRSQVREYDQRAGKVS